jgi:hypothetical protein
VGHPYYHRPEDDTEKIDPEILRKTGQFVLQGTINLADETEVELIIEDRETLYNAMQFSVRSFNPGEGDYERVEIGARDKDDLLQVVLDSARAMNTRLQEQVSQAPQAVPAQRMRGAASGGGKKSFNRGISNLAVFEGDLPLLLAAAEFIGFGRLDVEGDDGHWFSGGRLTPAGREAVAVLEENQIWLHLASPSQDLLEEVLSVSSKPFIVTGDYTVAPAMVDRINEKGVVLGVTMDPTDVEECISDLEGLKLQLGDTGNLVLSVLPAEDMDEAETALYLGLLEKGWDQVEIVGDRRAGGGVAGSNLNVFSGAGGRMFIMR